MDDSSYLNRPCPRFHHIEHKVVADYQHPVSKLPQTIVLGNCPNLRFNGQTGNGMVELFQHGNGSRWIVHQNVIEDGATGTLAGLCGSELVAAFRPAYFHLGEWQN